MLSSYFGSEAMLPKMLPTPQNVTNVTTFSNTDCFNRTSQEVGVSQEEHLAAAPSLLAIPPNSATILLDCLETQREARLRIEARDAEEIVVRQDRFQRLPMLRAQRARRAQLIAIDAEYVQKTTEMLEEVSDAVRDRCTSLRPEGYQAFAFPNGDVYEGTWKNARMHGKGVLRRFASRDLYEGQWFLGQRCGQGSLHSGDLKTFYHGTWLDNKRHGRGEMIEAEGFFTGEFVENRICGYGEYVFNDGHLYKGEWRDDMFHGTGTYLYPSGAKYEGMWHCGYESGRGTQIYANGDIYVGEWHDGRPHGNGTYTSASFRYDGSWAHGQMEGTGSCIFIDGVTYTGEWHCGKFHGQGVLHCPRDDQRYSGGFVAGKRHGIGEYVSAQVVYQGEWSQDKKAGYGRIEVMSCAPYEGVWKDDAPSEQNRLACRPSLDELCDAMCAAIEEAQKCRELDLRFPSRNGIPV